MKSVKQFCSKKKKKTVNYRLVLLVNYSREKYLFFMMPFCMK